jgi:hypothetical protein
MNWRATDFGAVVPAELDQDSRRESGYGHSVPTEINTFKGFKLLGGDR